MEITDIKIFKIKQRGALLGYANVIFNNSFLLLEVLKYWKMNEMEDLLQCLQED